MAISGLILLILAVAAAPAFADGGFSVPPTVEIPAGPFIIGSARKEREAAYLLDEKAYGSDVTRKGRWYGGERARARVVTTAFAITKTPITNRQYAAFIKDSGHSAPDVDARTWASYGLIYPYGRTRRYAWVRGRPPDGRGDHPVVLVSHADAAAYAAWLSRRTGGTWRLPTEEEWEKAARGTDGRMFPWGGDFDARLLNSGDRGPLDSEPVGRHPGGKSPFGLLDWAGQVFEWTATKAAKGLYIVKGGAWDDRGCGVCRPAARHGRPAGLKHIIIGFRLVRAVQD